MNIVISGIGIIGGSFAKAIKKYTDHYVIGINRSRQPLEDALKCGAIDEIGSRESLQKADLMILGTFPQAAVEFVERNAELIPKSCIVMDTSGIKSEICPKLTALSEQYGFTFVGCHPMAGKEKNGFAASDADLFSGASCILVPCGADERSVEKIAALAETLGFGKIVYASAEEHDRMIAFTSQLPHVIACSYVMSPVCPKHKGFSAGSYRDVSRVAHINEKLWAELFLENKEPLLDEIQILIDNLTAVKNAVDKGNKEELEELLAKSRKVKEELGE
ncbi:MAG: prephenate dehydrogenase [Clostridia bacterium]|nr:prephenate dehydrogenase [Clostridia bacterium]